jgi:hypothetical protein
MAARRAARALAWGGRRRGLAWLRSRFRASEIWFIGLAIVVGAAAGLLAIVQAAVATPCNRSSTASRWTSG